MNMKEQLEQQVTKANQTDPDEEFISDEFMDLAEEFNDIEELIDAQEIQDNRYLDDYDL